MENQFLARRRTRMISFRVTEHEFELLKVRSDAEGARSISDYAREALCRNDRGQATQVETAVTQLNDEIQQLRSQLLQITELLASSQRTASTRPPYTHRTARSEGRAPHTSDVQAHAEGRALQLAARKTGRG